MNAILFLAVRDVFKDKKTFLLISLAVGAGVAIIIPMQGLFVGITNNLYETTIDVATGHITIHPQNNERFVEHAGSVERKLRLLPGISGVSARLTDPVIITKKQNVVQSRLIGLTPSDERESTDISNRVIDGRFLNDGDSTEVVLGSMLAGELEVDTGERITITYSSGITEDYRVRGIIQTGIGSLDNGVYITKSEMEAKLDASDRASEIIVRLDDINLAGKYKLLIMQQGIVGNVKTWDEEVVYVTRIKSNWTFFSNVIFILSLVAASISVAVLMYTTVEHKIREIGILKAIGAKSAFVMYVFMAESCIYGITGVVLGSLIGSVITKYWEANPIMIATSEFTGIRAFYSVYLVIKPSLIILLATLLAGVYPAWRASRTNIIEAIWHG